MYNIPTILTSDELLDKLFHKASKITENQKIKKKVIRKKKMVLAKLSVISDSFDSTVSKYLIAFPSFDQVHRFEYELINISIGVDKIRKSLGAIDWARKQIRNLNSEISKKVTKINSITEYDHLDKYQNTFYGRVTSILKQVSSDLEFLNYARNHMKKMPTIDPEIITIVVAGFPNVGKSLVVKQISSAKPMIGIYPFTTKQLNLGHLMFKHNKVQIIDTPGLLDRSPNERNMIERQAVMALEHLADLIVFILDPTEHCGYSIDDQNKLLSELEELFSNIDIIIVENKADLFNTESDFLKISALEGSGLDELLEIIETKLYPDEN
jgi:nucleolar GTP-binding protein